MKFIPLILIFVVFYFLLIYPQSKKQKELRRKQSMLKRGDKIVTSSGILATISKTRDDAQEIEIEIAPGVKIQILRSAVGQILTGAEAQRAAANQNNNKGKAASGGIWGMMKKNKTEAKGETAKEVISETSAENDKDAKVLEGEIISEAGSEKDKAPIDSKV